MPQRTAILIIIPNPLFLLPTLHHDCQHLSAISSLLTFILFSTTQSMRYPNITPLSKHFPFSCHNYLVMATPQRGPCPLYLKEQELQFHCPRSLAINRFLRGISGMNQKHPTFAVLKGKIFSYLGFPFHMNWGSPQSKPTEASAKTFLRTHFLTLVIGCVCSITFCSSLVSKQLEGSVTVYPLYYHKSHPASIIMEFS